MINEFYLFCNKNQFKKYISVVCKNKTIDFYRKNRIKNEKYKISLNTLDENNEEYINKITGDSSDIISFINFDSIEKKDIDFLNIFFENNKRLTEKKVGIKLGLS